MPSKFSITLHCGLCQCLTILIYRRQRNSDLWRSEYTMLSISWGNIFWWQWQGGMPTSKNVSWRMQLPRAMRFNYLWDKHCPIGVCFSLLTFNINHECSGSEVLDAVSPRKKQRVYSYVKTRPNPTQTVPRFRNPQILKLNTFMNRLNPARPVRLFWNADLPVR